MCAGGMSARVGGGGEQTNTVRESSESEEGYVVRNKPLFPRGIYLTVGGTQLEILYLQ